MEYIEHLKSAPASVVLVSDSDKLHNARDSCGPFARTRRELLTFDVLPAVGPDVALAAAANYRLLRRRGRTVRSTIDCLIATFCLTNGRALLHNDRDYDVFEEELRLAVVHPQGWGHPHQC